MKLIETAWLDYADKVLPKDAPPVQHSECRKAFYAGAGSLISSLLKVIGPGSEPTESDMLILDGVQDEIEQFVKDVQKEPQP